MKILLDVDGVVADMLPYIISYAKLEISIEDIRHWNFFLDLNESDLVKAKEAMVSYDFWRSLPIIEGAHEGVKTLESYGHDVYWLTALYRPCLDYPRARIEWLEENFDVHQDNIVITRTKALVSGDIFIDDKIENLDSWAGANKEGLAFLHEYHYNKDSPHHRFSWLDIPDFLKTQHTGYLI